MNHPTVICILFSLLFMSMSAYLTVDSCKLNDWAMSPQETELRDRLWEELQADQLASAEQAIVIEFEYHDLFINEVIPEYSLMLKYQRLLRSFGVQGGPQRQVQLLENGRILIGDFDDRGQLMGAPIRLGLAVASND